MATPIATIERLSADGQGANQARAIGGALSAAIAPEGHWPLLERLNAKAVWLADIADPAPATIRRRCTTIVGRGARSEDLAVICANVLAIGTQQALTGADWISWVARDHAKTAPIFDEAFLASTVAGVRVEFVTSKRPVVAIV